jgi:hypothetical protein
MASDHTRTASTRSPGEAFYIESTLPVAQTLGEYRSSRTRRPGRWRRIRRAARLTAPF